MGLWSKKKVDPLDLNKGYEWTKDDQVAVEELNAMTNCSLYAQDFVEKLVTNIDVSEAGLVGTPSVTLVDGDGATEGKPYKKFKFANLKGEKGDTGGVAPVVQGTGTATGSVMSQNAVTTELESKANLDASNLTDENIASWANKFFPVGSIYMSVDSTSPASFLGGTWERIKDCFLWATGDTASITYTENGVSVTKSLTAGSTGGEATHTLTNGEMPYHNHQLLRYLDTGSAYSAGYGAGDHTGILSETASTAYVPSMWTSYVGGNQPHNNMPPYLAVYMWKRTA